MNLTGGTPALHQAATPAQVRKRKTQFLKAGLAFALSLSPRHVDGVV
jgi:hypothetical protein